jgi:hypothetical protein
MVSRFLDDLDALEHQAHSRADPQPGSCRRGPVRIGTDIDFIGISRKCDTLGLLERQKEILTAVAPGTFRHLTFPSPMSVRKLV